MLSSHSDAKCCPRLAIIFSIASCIGVSLLLNVGVTPASSKLGIVVSSRVFFCALYRMQQGVLVAELGVLVSCFLLLVF